MKTLRFPHRDSEIVEEINLGAAGIVVLSLLVAHHREVTGGLSDQDQYVVAEVTRLEVLRVDGSENEEWVSWAQECINKMLRTGQIVVEVEERL